MITYRIGNALEPVGSPDEKKLILHVCNDYGGWGRGFVLGLSSRWLKPERRYREAKTLTLGSIQYAMVEPNLMVINMIAQHGNSTPTVPAIQYDALENCLVLVARANTSFNASIHMPRIGCGLGGGRWERVEEMIQSVFPVEANINVYDLPKGK